MAKTYSKKVRNIVRKAMRFAEEKRREGWTKEDFKKAFLQFLCNPDDPTILDGPRPGKDGV